MVNEQIESLLTIRDELMKIREKYKKRADKERAKVNNVYVTVSGEKCYTEDDINAWYMSDYITLKQCDKYIEKLEQKKEKAGQKDYMTKSERIVSIFDGYLTSIANEIEGIKFREEEERKRDERLKIAQEQGLSYSQWLELEEISRQSEEYENMRK